VTTTPAHPVYKSFLEKYEFVIPLALFIIFLAITLPGISWGGLNGWHPDEIVVRSIKALHGEWKFDEINFDYPSLPQYVMFGLGKLILAMGYTDLEVLIASRVLSTVLAGLTIVLTYVITRRISNNIYVAGLSGLLLLSVSEMTHNGRFAHNDTYITFFVTLTVLFLINYKLKNQRGWLYASFISIGMAASSKYNGISLVIVPVLLYLFSLRGSFLKRPLRILETLFIGGALTFLGYAAGTPKSLFWMTYYFKRMIPALLHTGNYARQPDSLRGILGQYGSFANGTGLPLFSLFAAALLWACYQVFQAYRSGSESQDSRITALVILLLSIAALDLPITVSYNYPTRFFLSMLPIFAVLSALFIEDLYRQAKARGNIQYQRLLSLGLAAIILFSFARNISVMLLFLNDARIPASEFINSLPVETSLEHTFYPPAIPLEHFEREHNYPIFFSKTPGEQAPTHKSYKYNAGEAGLDDRLTDYLVVDNFTIDRLSDPYICQSMQVECDFFKQLATGQSDHYKLIREFSYSLPRYLPPLKISFVNPEIRIYERLK
jgi:4-amino-4-deoxy-L-arabinose transferase-like glycosyltransferase